MEKLRTLLEDALESVIDERDDLSKQAAEIADKRSTLLGKALAYQEVLGTISEMEKSDADVPAGEAAQEDQGTD